MKPHIDNKSENFGRRTNSYAIALFVFALLQLNLSTYAQDKNAEIDKIFSWATPNAPGCTCAVSQNGKVIVNRAYGAADLERNVAISPNSIFDAGSLTKQFVAAATLLLVEEKKLSLSDSVRKYIPELPYYGHTITIDHLLTHTSGIRDWTGMMPLVNGSVDALVLTLRQRSLNFPPGEEWSYSNSGYVLLKEIIARISKMSFGEFAQKRLFDPLEMKSTSYREDLRSIIKNRALAYDKEGNGWRTAILLDNDRGGGGALLTTASDLVVWNDALTNNKLGLFVTGKMQEHTKLNNGRSLDYARGLILDSYRGTSEVWHSGSADGYKSWLGRYPEYGLSIAIMCNSGDGTDRRNFAHRIFDVFVPDTASQKNSIAKSQPMSADTSAINLKSRAGLYLNEKNGDLFRLVTDGSRLRVAAGPDLEPIAPNLFKQRGTFTQFMSQDQIELNFISNDEFEMKSLEGKITKYHRAEPFAPTSADLAVFAGRYESDEIGCVFVITPGKDGVTIKLEHSPTRILEFKPVASDTFQRSLATVQFNRDKSGQVISLDYSNPLLRKVKFTRSGDNIVHR